MYIIFVGWIAGNVWAILSLVISGGVGALIITITFTPFTVFLFIPLWLRTYYELGEEELTIRSGLGKGTKISYDQMLNASRTRDPVSSPALSMDRLSIKFRTKSGRFNDSIIISPKGTEEFLRLLKEKNNNIEISTDVKPLSVGYKVLFGFTAAMVAATGVMLLVGMQDPAVSVGADRIRIGGMYGLSVYFTEMTAVTLVEKSMNEIYAGESVVRTNGFGGMGQSNKGHFRSRTYGEHRLYVQARTSPTIHIKRRGGDIFISFRNSEKTERLYDEMISAMMPR